MRSAKYGKTDELLERLLDVIMTGKKIPMSNLYMIDREQCKTIIGQINDNLPEEVANAKGIIDNETSIIAEAREVAAQTKQEAGVQARNFVAGAEANAKAIEQRANQSYAQAQEKSRLMIQEANAKASSIVSNAEKHAAQLVSEQEVVARAQMEAEEIRQDTQAEVEKLYRDVYKHIDDILVQLDRSISEKLTDIRLTRQQIDQSMSSR